MINKEKHLFSDTPETDRDIKKRHKRTANEYLRALKLSKKEKRLFKKQIRKAHRELDISRL